MGSVDDPIRVGEVVERGHRVCVWAWLDGDELFLHRKLIDNPHDVDSPITLVTREGLLRLSQGPFEKGFVEDHL